MTASDTHDSDGETRGDAPPPPTGPGVVLRAAFGGVLMGLANLVPGISGGTMLLAAGVYTAFIRAIADVTTLRFRFASIQLIAIVAVAAGLAILLLAGPVKDLVVNHRWIMYSLFIGLTLGGVPLVWRMMKPASPVAFVSAAVAFCLMAVMAWSGPAGGGGDSNFFMLLIAGVAGASAMILPGVSGGYLLLLLGQYVPILASIGRVKDALKATDVSALLAETAVVIPVGLGVLIGIVGVSNLVRFALDRYRQATLGFLLGLLIGSVAGLWPFMAPVPPVIGDMIKGVAVTEQTIGLIEPEDWAVVAFSPSPVQIAGSLGLVAIGLLVTLGIARLGREKDSAADREPPRRREPAS